MHRHLGSLIALLAGVCIGFPVHAADTELNIYSARHYDSDALLYDGFEKATGIPINVIEGNGPELMARMKAEGANSPADIFITVDAGNLWLAEKENLFQGVQSQLLTARIPASLRNPRNLWFGFSTRARVIFVNKDKVDPASVRTYESLADPRLRGQICMRTSSAVYNLSLLGSLIERWGAERAEAWTNGVVANFARPPQGNDTSLLRDVAAGACGVTIANHYYFVRLQNSSNPAERDAAKALTVVMPDQGGTGVHVNISGAGVLAHAPHKDAAVKFLEYLAGDEAQHIFANANYEFPAAIRPQTEELTAFGDFKSDPTNVSVYGVNQARAQMIFNRAGWR